MFSGIVEDTAKVVRIEHDQDNVHLTLSCSFVEELSIDQSVAHNGVCLTVVSLQDGTYTVTAMRETLECTNIGLLSVGDEVNVERSMLMNGRLDGHIVQGHVDQTARCIAVDDRRVHGSSPSSTRAARTWCAAATSAWTRAASPSMASPSPYAAPRKTPSRFASFPTLSSTPTSTTSRWAPW